MQRLINFNDFLFNSLFESAEKNPLAFRLSPRLIQLLRSIRDPISKDLLGIDGGVSKDATLVDYDETDINKFTYVLSSKLYDYISHKHNREDPYTIHKLFTSYYNQGIGNELWTLFRTSSRIGGFVNRVFPNKYNEKEVEFFVNAVKAKRTQKFDNFKIVKGEDIRKYYSSENYDNRANNSTGLGISCMRYKKCQPFFDFYINNNVEMIVLMSDDEHQKDKIMGRAILWDIKNIDGKIVDRKFMDRIYTISEYHTQTFKDYATKNGWLYKRGQNRHPNEPICDPMDNNSCRERILMTDNNYKKTKYFPYLDSMAFFYWKDGYLSNNGNLVEDTSEQPYFIQNAQGTYTVQGMRFVLHYNELIPEDDLTWCQYGNDWRYRDDAVEFNGNYATQQYIDENRLKYSELMGEWINRDNSIFVSYYDCYVTQEFADNNMTYSEHDEEYYRQDEVVWSDYNESYLLKDKAVKVVVNKDGRTDWRSKDDSSSYIQYENRRSFSGVKYFDKEVFNKDFVLCSTILRSYEVTVWKHLEWDKDKIVDHKGKYFYDVTEEQIKNYMKQHE